MGFLKTIFINTSSQGFLQHRRGSVILVQVAFATRSVGQDHPREEQWNKEAKPQGTRTFHG